MVPGKARAIAAVLLAAGCTEQASALDAGVRDAGEVDSGPACEPAEPSWGYVIDPLATDPVAVEGPATFSPGRTADELALTFDSGEAFAVGGREAPPFLAGARAYVALEVTRCACPVGGGNDSRMAIWTLGDDGGPAEFVLVRWNVTDSFLEGEFAGLHYSLPRSVLVPHVAVCGAEHHALDLLVAGRGITVRVPPRCSETTAQGLIVSNHLGRETVGWSTCTNDDSARRSASGQIRDSTVRFP